MSETNISVVFGAYCPLGTEFVTGVKVDSNSFTYLNLEQIETHYLALLK